MSNHEVQDPEYLLELFVKRTYLTVEPVVEPLRRTQSWSCSDSTSSNTNSSGYAQAAASSYGPTDGLDNQHTIFDSSGEDGKSNVSLDPGDRGDSGIDLGTHNPWKLKTQHIEIPTEAQTSESSHLQRQGVLTGPFQYGYSEGSLQHDSEGGCKPCSYMTKRGCPKGVSCKFCHLEHEDLTSSIRPSKEKRAFLKGILQSTIAKHEDDPEACRKACIELAVKNVYIRRLLQELPIFQGVDTKAALRTRLDNGSVDQSVTVSQMTQIGDTKVSL
eukprot:TRINITY_DN11530_c0_g2_i6.p1 TRINITY_DN11530_c0_g2~~TRINITY_DN11530_c0_g2_i6.p1  ORF type:complete len:273 (-),score=22.67 TRINITY_DN11530_c0_g2_i6:367-1185(-)